MQRVTTLPQLPKRPRDSHKGDFGKVLVIAGSRGMTGAAFLTAEGALRSGAGLVVVATPKSQQPVLAAKLTCAMTYPLPETKEGCLSSTARPQILKLAKDSDVITLGPGISQHPQTVKLVLSVLPFLRSPGATAESRPIRGVVIDADGLNALSHNPNILKKATAPVILTPHPGEMERLSGSKGEKYKSSRVKIAMKFAQKYKVVVALKGYQTVVTDGIKVYINNTGNSGMATGGTGDVLTGIIAGLLGQRLTPFEATQLGVYLHGLAGDFASKRIGETSLIATDIIEHLSKAIKSYISSDPNK